MDYAGINNAIASLPTDYTRRYRIAMKAWLFAGTWHHSYELIGAAGAVHVHFSGPHHYSNEDHWSAGIEFHNRFPPSDEPPSHNHCEILKCPCWHDGSSMWAEERFLPMFKRGDHDGIFRAMVSAADDRMPFKCLPMDRE